MNKLIGYFEEFSDTPTYNPPLNSPCIICGKIMESDRMTISLALMPEDNPDRSYFYRVHKVCYLETSEQDISDIEGSILNI